MNADATVTELESRLSEVRDAPADEGILELIVRRPCVDAREVLEVGRLTVDDGLAGDSWRDRPNRKSADGGPHPEMQLNIMSARAARLVAGPDPARWALAGDQLYVDLDLREANLPPGTLLEIGQAVVEITAEPHNGCAKFRERFGPGASKVVNSAEGKALKLRGVNAKVVTTGEIRRGDRVRKISAS